MTKKTKTSAHFQLEKKESNNAEAKRQSLLNKQRLQKAQKAKNNAQKAKNNAQKAKIKQQAEKNLQQAEQNVQQAEKNKLNAARFMSWKETN